MDTYVVLKNFKDSKNDFSLHLEGEDVKLSKERAKEISEDKSGPYIRLKTAKDEKVDNAAKKEDKADGADLTKEEKSDDASITKVEKSDDESVTKEVKATGSKAKSK